MAIERAKSMTVDIAYPELLDDIKLNEYYENIIYYIGSNYREHKRLLYEVRQPGTPSSKFWSPIKPKN